MTFVADSAGSSSGNSSNPSSDISGDNGLFLHSGLVCLELQVASQMLPAAYMHDVDVL